MLTRRMIRDITDFIFLNEPLHKAEALFIPGNWSHELPEEAARLYHQGWCDYLVPSGRHSIKVGAFPGPRQKREVYPPPYTTEAAFFAQVLKTHQVPENVIFKEENATYTYQNAVFTKELLDKMGLNPKTAIIVCRYPHARRCLMAYQLAFPQTEFIVRGTPCDFLPHPDTWHTSEEDIRHVLGELEKCGGQMVDAVLRQAEPLPVPKGPWRAPV